MAQLNFDASQVAPDTGAVTVPAGWYNVQMDESEIKPTSKGDGAYLQCRFSILDGQFQNRKLFSRFNIRNPNPVAAEIGFKQLSAVAHAVGVLQVNDSQQLHGRPLKVKVKVRKATDDYDEQNEISAYRNINEVVDQPAGAVAAQVFGAGPAAGAGGVPAGFGTGAATQQFAQPQANMVAPQPWGQPQAQPQMQPQVQQPQYQPQPGQQFQPQAQPQAQPQYQPQPGMQPQYQPQPGAGQPQFQPQAQPQFQPQVQQPQVQQPQGQPDPAAQAQVAVPPWQR